MSAAEKKQESPVPLLLRGSHHKHHLQVLRTASSQQPPPCPHNHHFPLDFIPSKLSSSTQDKQSGCLSTGKDKKEKRNDSFTGHQHMPSPAGKQVFILSYHHHESRAGDHHPSFIDGDTCILGKWTNHPRPLKNEVSRLVQRSANQTCMLFGWPGLPLGSQFQFLYSACPQVCCIPRLAPLGSRIKSSTCSHARHLNVNTNISWSNLFCWSRVRSLCDLENSAAHKGQQEAQMVIINVLARCMGSASRTGVLFHFRPGKGSVPWKKGPHWSLMPHTLVTVLTRFLYILSGWRAKTSKLPSKAKRATPINIICFKKLKAGKQLILHLF